MDTQAVTYTNALGRVLAPVLEPVRATGFFEAPVYISLMTLAAALLFWALQRRLADGGVGAPEPHPIPRRLLQAVYFGQCFLVTNSTAVAFKTLIVEELDYDVLPWFTPWVGPLHFYITSVAAAHLWLVWRGRRRPLDLALCAYVQLGLLGGYATAFHRLANEPFEWTDPTTGMSGTFFLLWFGVLNVDVGVRAVPARRPPRETA